jgi:hypothetical protein
VNEPQKEEEVMDKGIDEELPRGSETILSWKIIMRFGG